MWILPVPGPPTRTTLCASSRNSQRWSWRDECLVDLAAGGMASAATNSRLISPIAVARAHATYQNAPVHSEYGA